MTNEHHIAAEWLHAPNVRAVCNAFTNTEKSVFFVGGCVRNALLGVASGDIDMATDATPDETTKIAQSAGLKVIPTGIDHGTVTVLSGGQGFEITTFRRDVDTDGRHATVHFSTDIADDAARRDFTMNALYAAPDGTILDPLGGLADIKSRRLRFIGDAAQRIREDYLRTLRYFRFHAFYADRSSGFDADALAAIAETLDGLPSLSRERVGSEVLKLLSASDPAPEFAVMSQVGVLSALFDGMDPKPLAPLIHFEQSLNLAPDPIRRLAAIFGNETAQNSLRLTNTQTRRWQLLRDHIGSMMAPAELGYRLGNDSVDVLALRAAVLETPLNPHDLTAARQAIGQKFPIAARDLMPDYHGKELGGRLKFLEQIWISSGFQATKHHLLQMPPDTSG